MAAADSGHPSAQQWSPAGEQKEGQAGARTQAVQGRPGRQDIRKQNDADPDREVQAGDHQAGAAAQRAEGEYYYG